MSNEATNINGAILPSNGGWPFNSRPSEVACRRTLVAQVPLQLARAGVGPAMHHAIAPCHSEAWHTAAIGVLHHGAEPPVVGEARLAAEKRCQQIATRHTSCSPCGTRAGLQPRADYPLLVGRRGELMARDCAPDGRAGLLVRQAGLSGGPGRRASYCASGARSLEGGRTKRACQYLRAHARADRLSRRG